LEAPRKRRPLGVEKRGDDTRRGIRTREFKRSQVWADESRCQLGNVIDFQFLEKEPKPLQAAGSPDKVTQTAQVADLGAVVRYFKRSKPITAG
jgi:hypothetical protein